MDNASTVRPVMVNRSSLLVPDTTTFIVNVESVRPPVGIVTEVIFRAAMNDVVMVALVQNCQPAGAWSTNTLVPTLKSVATPSRTKMFPVAVQPGVVPVRAFLAQMLDAPTGAVIVDVARAAQWEPTANKMRNKAFKRINTPFFKKNKPSAQVI